MELAVDAYPVIALRLLAAFILGGLLGLEREWQQRPAGLRTHILVSVASSLFTILSAAAAEGGGDPARVAAGVTTGIGFIGAGTIMRHGNVVRGLTTAASLWMVAAIGVACGVGWYPAALFTTVLGLVTLGAVEWFEDLLIRRSGAVQYNLATDLERDPLSTIAALLDRMGVMVLSVKYGPAKAGQARALSIRVRVADKLARVQLCRELEKVDGVCDVQME